MFKFPDHLDPLKISERAWTQGFAAGLALGALAVAVAWLVVVTLRKK